METACTLNRKSGAKRNLNESFNDSITSPIQNYSIISVEEKDSKDSLLVKLRKSTTNPCVILNKLSNTVSTNFTKNDDLKNFITASELKISSHVYVEKLEPFLNEKEICDTDIDETIQLEDEKAVCSSAQKLQQKLCSNSCLSIEKVKLLPKLNVICNNGINNNTPQSDNEKILRRSARKVQRKSYVDFTSPPKTPKRNRKLSTSSESSTAVSIEHLSPAKKAYTQTPSKNKITVTGNKLDNTPSKRHRIRCEDSKSKNNGENTIDSKSRHKDFNKIKHSTPLEDEMAPENNRPRRNVSAPLRYYDSDDNFSPTKKKKTTRQYVKDSDTSDEETTSMVGTPKLRQCFVDITRHKTLEDTVALTPRRKEIKPILKTNNLQTPKKIRHYGKQTEHVTTYEDVIEMTTPHKRIYMENNLTPKSATRNTPSAKAKLIRAGTITPSVQMRATPIKSNTTPLNKARVKLHVSYVPNVLPCREREYNDIFNFLEGKLLDGCGGCMYVSGVPGTGKTATVTDVIRKLENKSKSGIVPNFQFVNVNGMKLSEPRQSYVEILKQLTGKSLSWEQAQLSLDNRFTKHNKICKPIILLVDELDILCTKRQDVVYNLLDWPTRASVQLIVITIANTMDLPERLLMGRVTSRLGLTRLTFQAYTHKQLQEIVTTRLVGTKVFNPDAVQLVARKVASVSGDARRALDICRRAAEIAELQGQDTLVSMNHVNEALNAMITQPKVQAIKYCSRLQQLILQAVVAEVERTGVEETTFSDVYSMFQSIATIDGFQKVSCTLALAAVSKLGACRLLLTDQKLNEFHQKLILNVSSDDVYYALRKE